MANVVLPALKSTLPPAITVVPSALQNSPCSSDLHQSNTEEDLALSRTLAEETAERCWDATANRKDMGAEWYLRVRDCLYRNAWKK